MKRFCLIVLLFALGVSFADAAGARGNGNIVTIERNMSSFEEINVMGWVVVNYHQSQEYRTVIRIDSNLEEDLDIFAANGKLNIGPKMGRRINPTEFTVDVYCPSLSGISIAGSVRFEGKDKINARDFDLRISGSARIKGNFECESFSTRVSGSGEIDGSLVCNSFSANSSGSVKITLAGSCNDMDITITGSGTFEGNEFRTNNAAVRASGSARINVWVLENLSARVSGSGRVRYRGNPTIDFSGSGAARLERI